MLLNPLQCLEAEVENTTGPSGNAALFGSQDSPFQETLQQAHQDLDAHLGQASPTGSSQTVYPSLAKLIEGILADRSLQTDPNAPKLPEWGAESEPPAQEGENLSSALGWGQAERPAPARDQDPTILEEIQDGESRNPKEHPLSGKGLERLKDAVLDHANPVLQEREASHVALLQRESPEPVEHPNSGEITATQDPGSSQVEPPRRAEGDGGGILSSDSVPSGGIPFISGPSFGIQPVLERFGSEGNGGWAGGEAPSRPHPAQPVLLKPEAPPENTKSESFGHLKNPQRGQPPVDPLFGEQSEGEIPESSGLLRQVRSGDTPQTPEKEAGRFSQPLDSEQDATPKPEDQRIQEVREPVSARPTQAVQAPSSPRPSQLTGNEPVQQRGPGPEVLQETHRVTDQLVRGARLLSRDGTTQVTLRLDPPELGEVTVRLASVNDTVTGEIAVGNREAYQVVRGNLADLMESLIKQGVLVDHIEVSIDQRGSAGADREPASPSSRDASDRTAEEDSDNSRQNRDPREESRQRGSTPQDGDVDFTA